MSSSLIYLDYAAATPMDPAVYRAMQPYFTEVFYNPSATYLPAQTVHKDLEAARSHIAHWLGARPAEIIYTAGGTEANNLAIRGVLEQFPGSNVVVSAIEHESVLAAAHQYAGKEVPVTLQGVVTADAVTALVDDKTVLVSIMYANNEVGTIQPISQIARALEKIRKARRAAGNNLPLYFHTDAAQAANYLDLHAARLGVDLMTINGGKIYGPKQSGALYIASHVRLQPQVFGGGQERGYRSGTENVAGVIGLAAALDLVQNRRHEEVTRQHALQQLFLHELETHVPQAIINGPRKNRLPNNVHITVPGQDNERLLLELEQRGILAAAGSACSASNEEPSHVLRAMGISNADAQASLRFTMGHATTESHIHTLVQTLHKLVT